MLGKHIKARFNQLGYRNPQFNNNYNDLQSFDVLYILLDDDGL